MTDMKTDEKTEPSVLYESAGGVARITLNEPDRRNVLSFELVQALNDALGAAAGDGGAKVAILAANGPAFCAGMDLKKISLDSPDDAKKFSKLLAESYRRLLRLPMPLLCAVDGPAMGGAVGLALGADLVWAGPKAKFAFPETRVGVVPALVSIPARRRLTVGRLHAMALTGIALDAPEAVRAGLAEFDSADSALADAEAFAQKILAENSAEAMRRTKAFLQAQFLENLDDEIGDALKEFKRAVATDACRKGLEAFRNKRPINWSEAEKTAD